MSLLLITHSSHYAVKEVCDKAEVVTSKLLLPCLPCRCRESRELASSLSKASKLILSKAKKPDQQQTERDEVRVDAGQGSLRMKAATLMRTTRYQAVRTNEMEHLITSHA